MSTLRRIVTLDVCTSLMDAFRTRSPFPARTVIREEIGSFEGVSVRAERYPTPIYELDARAFRRATPVPTRVGNLRGLSTRSSPVLVDVRERLSHLGSLRVLTATAPSISLPTGVASPGGTVRPDVAGISPSLPPIPDAALAELRAERGLLDDAELVHVTLRMQPVLARVPAAAPKVVAIPVDFEDQDALTRFEQERGPKVKGIFVDPPIGPVGGVEAGPFGTLKGVHFRLGTEKLKKWGLDGSNTRIAIMDGGIHAASVPAANVVRGWHPTDTSYVAGSASLGHGTMCTRCAAIAAPEAEFLDYALLAGATGTLPAFLSDALAAFAHLRDENKDGMSLVVNNSWQLFNTAHDLPHSSPQSYSGNPEHPFNQLVAALVSEGADVVFAAGNCGSPDPVTGCGPGDIGPGKSILGANGHPDVITVAGVTYHYDRITCSAQGPALLAPDKPDLAGFSQFKGPSVQPTGHAGTSAAAAVVSGAVAALRSRLPELAAVDMRELLMDTAKSDGTFSADLGYGVVRPVAAARAMNLD